MFPSSSRNKDDFPPKLNLSQLLINMTPHTRSSHINPYLLRNGYRTEQDSMGEIKVPANAYWMATTQRSLEHLDINLPIDKMPYKFSICLALMKKAAVICCAQGYAPEGIETIVNGIEVSHARDDIYTNGKVDSLAVSYPLHSSLSKSSSDAQTDKTNSGRGYGLISMAKAVCIALACDEVIGGRQCDYKWKAAVEEEERCCDATTTTTTTTTASTSVNNHDPECPYNEPDNIPTTQQSQEQHSSHYKHNLTTHANLIFSHTDTVLDFIEHNIVSSPLFEFHPLESDGTLDKYDLTMHFPLCIWQTGSGTHSNMNANEVIATRATAIAHILGFSSCHDYIPSHLDAQNTPTKDVNRLNTGSPLLIHPNNDVNICQSSNDTFPTAMHLVSIFDTLALLSSISSLTASFQHLHDQHTQTIKLGRTHLRDATPITLSMELGVYISSLNYTAYSLTNVLHSLCCLPIAGTAVGNGITTYHNFDIGVTHMLSLLMNIPLYSLKNKSYSLTLHEPFSSLSHALSTLASSFIKLCNDWRYYDSGPRAGVSEYIIHPLEPGSSIMPGKTNPTQLESLSQVCVFVMSSGASIDVGNSLGHCQLNAYKPLIGVTCSSNMSRMTQSIDRFNKYCVKLLDFNTKNMKANVDNSLMLITQLNQIIGYQYGSIISKYCFNNDLTLKEVMIEQLGVFKDEKEYDYHMNPIEMTTVDDLQVLHDRIVKKMRKIESSEKEHGVELSEEAISKINAMNGQNVNHSKPNDGNDHATHKKTQSGVHDDIKVDRVIG